MKELFQQINHLFKKDVEVSILLDMEDIINVEEGTEYGVEYSRVFYDKLYDAFNPLVVHTHINDTELPSLYDLVTWCSNEEIHGTAIFSIHSDAIYGKMYYKRKGYISPATVYRIWSRCVDEFSNFKDIVHAALWELDIEIIDSVTIVKEERKRIKKTTAS